MLHTLPTTATFHGRRRLAERGVCLDDALEVVRCHDRAHPTTTRSGHPAVAYVSDSAALTVVVVDCVDGSTAVHTAYTPRSMAGAR